MNRQLVKESYDTWQAIGAKLFTIERWKKRMRSKKIQKLIRIEHKAHWRYLRRALELDQQNRGQHG
jgi:hypothetical protein